MCCRCCGLLDSQAPRLLERGWRARERRAPSTRDFLGRVCEIEPLQLSLHRHQDRSPFVLHLEHYKFRWFSLACVPANDMNIVGRFIKALTRCQGNFFSAFTCITTEPSSM